MKKNEKLLQRSEIESLETEVAKRLNSEVRVSINYGKRKSIKIAFTMLFQEAAKKASILLSGTTNRVFLYLLGTSGFENYCPIDQKTLSEDLNLSSATIRRSLDELKGLNVVLPFKTTSDKRRNEYYINPTAAWKGEAGKREKALKIMAKENPMQLDLFNEQKQLALVPSEFSQGVRGAEATL